MFNCRNVLCNVLPAANGLLFATTSRDALSDQTKDFQPISSEQRQQKSSQDHKGQAFITCLLPFLAGDMWTKKNN